MVTGEISVPDFGDVDGMDLAGQIHVKKGSVTPSTQGLAVVRIGTRTRVASNVKITGLAVYPYQSISGDFSHPFYGIGGRCEQDPLSTATDITVTGCYVEDSALGIVIAKNVVANTAAAADRLAARFRRVRFNGNTVVNTSNKAIEVQETVGCQVIGNNYLS